MTATERWRRHRARKFGDSAPATKSHTKPAVDMEAVLLKQELAQVKQELARAKARIQELEQQQAAHADGQRVDAVPRRRLDEQSERNARAQRQPARQATRTPGSAK